MANQTYIRYGEPDYPTNLNLDPDDFTPGKGYWMVQNVVDDCEIDIVGAEYEGAVSQADRFESEVLQKPVGDYRGVNMMANPYPYTYDWRETYITDGSESKTIIEVAAANWVHGYAAVWDEVDQQFITIKYLGSTEPFEIEAWKGFLFEQKDPSKDIQIQFTPRWMWSEGGGGLDVDEIIWELQLPVVTVDGDYRDEYNLAGVSSLSSDEYDMLDAPEYTPYNTSYVQLFFSHYEWEMGAELFTYDYRSTDFSEPKSWDFTVGIYNLPNRQFVLSWPNISGIDTDYHFSLDDLTNGINIADMREVSDYTFAGGSSSVEAVYFRLTVDYTETSVEPVTELVEKDFGLISTYPNPFNSQIHITFKLPSSQMVNLIVYDILGREAATLAQGVLATGMHTAIWNAHSKASGIYFLHLEYGGEVVNRKILLLK